MLPPLLQAAVTSPTLASSNLASHRLHPPHWPSSSTPSCSSSYTRRVRIWWQRPSAARGRKM
jgi:hypothetical protein